MFLKRRLKEHIDLMLKKFPIVSISGPRQSGKTTLLRNYFPEYKYFNLERLDIREMILSDPVGFLNHNGEKVIFDEAQNIPELFSYLQVISDERNTTGQYILSGSQSFLLNQNISQSLAGRVNINHLFPFDFLELKQEFNSSHYKLIFSGFYPRVYDKQINPKDFYPSYLETYIERDIRQLKMIENLSGFIRFLGLCAGRVGQLLNLSSLANDTGVSVNTIKSWISLLEASFVIYLLRPYYKNFNKRLIKSPKIYFYDVGVASSLLKIQNEELVKTHYAYGSLFENLVISEILKIFYHSGEKPNIYYWRESNGTEIDLIIEKNNEKIFVIEIKGGETFTKSYLNNLKKFPEDKGVEKFLIYAGKEETIIDGIKIFGWNNFDNFVKYLLN